MPAFLGRKQRESGSGNKGKWARAKRNGGMRENYNCVVLYERRGRKKKNIVKRENTYIIREKI